MQVCELVVEGLTNKEIAERLDITVHTVKVHRAEVMRQMGVESVAELVRAVMAPQPTEGGSPSLMWPVRCASSWWKIRTCCAS